MSLTVDQVAALTPSKPMMYMESSINHLLSLSREDLELDLMTNGRYPGLDELFAYYLTTHNEIDWKLAAMMFKYCYYNQVMHEIDEFTYELDRGRNRLRYLRDGDV